MTTEGAHCAPPGGRNPGARPSRADPRSGCGIKARSSINDDAADRLAGVHQIEALVDLAERQLVGDQVVDIDLSVHVPIDDPGHVGPALGAAERGALPDAAGDQLEGTGRDLLPGPGDADDDADPPPAVATFERLAHGRDIADALEAVVGSPLRQADEMRHQIAADLGRIDEVRHAEFLRERLAPGVDVDADDHVGPDHAAALNDV